MRAHPFVAALAAMFVACGVSACGDSESGSESSSSSSSSGSSSAVDPKAEQTIEDERQPPEAIKLPPLPKKPEPATLIHVSCKSVECDAGDKGFKVAADRIGWKLKVLKSGFSPEEYSAAMTQALGESPDAITYIHLAPDATIRQQLETARSKGIPLVTAASPEPIGGDTGIVGNATGSRWFEKAGLVMADWVATDSKGKGNAVFLSDPATVSVKQTEEAFMKEIKAVCSGCKVDALAVSVADAGEKIPGKLVSYLQTNPDVKYVIGASGTYMLGVPQAFKAANMDVKVGNAIGTQAVLDAVKKGDQAMVYMQEVNATAYRMVDMAARALQDAPLPKDIAEPIGEGQVVDQTNASSIDTSVPWDVPDLEQSFVTAWNLED